MLKSDVSQDPGKIREYVKPNSEVDENLLNTTKSKPKKEPFKWEFFLGYTLTLRSLIAGHHRNCRCISVNWDTTILKHLNSESV